jgi:molybdate transport system substrate-binding protein
VRAAASVIGRGVGAAGSALVLALNAAPSLAAEVRVYVSGAPAEVVQILAERFSATTGHRILLTSGTIAEIARRLAAGETPDLVILPVPAIETLDQAGRLMRESRADVARVGIGIAVRAGAPLPDISTVGAVRQTLLDARAIVHPDPAGGGFAGAQVARMMVRLGIADAVKPKLSYRSAIRGGTAAVANGEAEVGLFNISEILPAQGVTLVGPLPPELQSYITFSAVLDVGAVSPEAARAFQRALTDAGAAGAWRKGGFEPLGHP